MTASRLNQASDAPLWLQVRRARRRSYELLSDFGIGRQPVDVDWLTRAMGIHLHYLPNPGWDGAVMSNERRAEIWIRSDTFRGRQRFTIAHEIGHLMLHPLGTEFRDVAPGTVQHSPQEQQANAFAAALLMPKFLVQPLMYHSSLSVEEMAQRFDVSVQAMGIRLDWIRSGREDL